MSGTYDDRIVRMGFDNAKFEAGAKESMSTLDKLNEKLKLKGASEGSSNVQREINGMNFSALERSIENIERRFSTMGIVGMNVINKITNGIAGSVKQLEQATIGQIKSGGWSRAMNIANAKFQIEGLGFAWEEVEKAVNYGVKDTAYGLDAAASAASQLAASGVDFKKTLETVNGQGLTAMHKSLRAISGVAAMTNSSYEDIARIFTTVAGNGRLMGDQLLQLSSRGMNAAAKLAEVLNTSEEAVRDMVSRGQIDFQTFAFAMDDAFGQHAKEANKTFTGALGNMKAALSRFGEIFSSPIINKTNTLFIALTARIDEFKNKLKSVEVPKSLEEIKKEYDGITASATAFDQILKQAGEKTVTFADHFAAMWESGINAFSKMIEAVDISWFDKIVEKVDNVTVKLKEFFDLIAEIYSDSAEEAADGINDATKTLVVSAKEAQAAKDIVFKGMYGAGAARKKALTELFGGGEEGKKHAENVQAYVDSVVAAGWSFEKASIKVAGANDDLADSTGKVAHEVKKARIKSVIDNITGGLSNLWTVAKNLWTAASKVARAILTAFSSVFNLNFETITDGTYSFTESLVKLSKKLIISDSTATKITEVFKKFFGVVQKGLGYLKSAAEFAKNFAVSIGESKTFETLKKTLGDLFDKIGEFEIFKIDENNPVIQAFSNILKAIDDLVTSNEDGPSKFTTFINNLIDAVTSVKWGALGKFAGLAIGLYSLFKIIFALKALGSLLISIASLPANISSFFWKLGKAALDTSWAYVLVSIAKSIAIVAAAIVVLSQIPEQQLYLGLGSVIAIALVMKYLLKSATGLMITLTQFTDMKAGFVASATSLFSMVKIVFALGALMVALAGATLILSAAVSLLGKMQPSWKDFGMVAGLLVLLSTVVGAILKFIGTMSTGAMFRVPVVLSAMSLMFVALGGAVLMMAGAVAILSTVPKEAFGSTIVLIGVIFGGIALMLAHVGNLNAGSLVSSAATFGAIGGALSGLMLSIAGALWIISIAFNNLPKFDEETGKSIIALGGIFVMILVGVIGLMAMISAVANTSGLAASTVAFASIGGAISGVILSMAGALLLISIAFNNLPKFDEGTGKSIIALGAMFTVMLVGVIALVAQANAIASGATGGLKTPVILATMSSVIISMGVAVALIAASMKIIADVPDDVIGSAMMTVAVIFGGMIAIMKISSELKPAQMLSAAAMFIAVSAATVIMAGAISVLSRLGSDKMIQSAGAIFMVLIGIGLAVTLASTTLKDTQNSAGTIIAGILAITIAIAIVSVALSKLSNTKHIMESALAITLIMMVLGAMFAAIASSTGSNGSSADALLAIGAAFIMVAGAMLILAFAMEKMASISDGLSTAAITFGVFAGAIVVLGIIGSLLGEKFTNAIMAVGKAFMYAGIGAALIGAGFYLVCAAIKVLAPAIGVMAVTLEQLFEVIEKHKPMVIITGVAILAVMTMLTIAIIKLAPVLVAIAQTVAETVKTISGTLNKGQSKLKERASNLTVRAKSMIAAAIVTLCAAIMKASPEVLNTVGKLLIKLLAFLGSIAGDLAMGLLDFLINLVNGLADAIRANSARIAAAIWGVVLALFDVVMQIIGQLIYMIVAPWSEEAANKIADFVNSASDGINLYAMEQRKLAEEADKNKRDYINSIRDAAAASEEASARTGNALSSMTDVLKTEFGEQKSGIDELKEQYGDLPGYAYDAILRSQNPNLGYEKNSKKMGINTAEAFVEGEESVDIPGMEDLMNENGLSIDAAGEFGNLMGTEYSSQEAGAMTNPDEFYQASDENMGGSTQAIEDSEDDTRKAIQDHYVKPSKEEMGKARPEWYKGANQCVEGAAQAIAENQWKYRSAITAMARLAVEDFERENKISSPSRVYRQLGEYIVLGLAGGITQNTTDVSKAVSGMSNSAFNALVVSTDKYYDSGESIVDSFVSGIAQNENDITDAISGINAITDSPIYTNNKSYYQSGQRVVERFSDGIAQNAGLATRSTDNLSDTIRSSIRSAADVFSDNSIFRTDDMSTAFYRNGESLVSSFTNGIAQNADSVTVVSSTLSDLVSVSLNSLPNMYYRNGESLVSGLTDGIAQNAESAIGAANNLSDAVVNAFGTPINYVGKISTGELQYDASVRPVFDDRGLYRGASSIDTMLNSQTISVSGLTGQLAADIGTLDRNNADIVDELKALREDMSYMEEAMSQMQVVMDTGALVGSMAGPMDKAMGRRAIYRGRGN